MPTKPETLLDVRDLQVHFALRGGFGARLLGRSEGSVKAVDGVNFSLRRGEVLGLVGESGSGKTTLGRAILRLVKPTSGSVEYGGEDVSGRSEAAFRPLRRQLQMIFQDPHAALNPAMDIGTAVAHPLQIHGLVTDKAERRKRAAEALERVGLAPAERFLSKYPGDLSGGQKQRAVIARAIILDPELVIADEPVSMLDMSVRSKILQLMIDLKRDLDLTYLYITHDLATAKFFCDRIAIMYLGRIVEIGPAAQIYADPKHPYTKSLLRAIPEPDPDRALPRDLPRGEVPDAVAPPHGCSFHPRCPEAFDSCGWESRDLRTLLESRWTHEGEDVFEAERPVVGDLDALDEPASEVVLEAGSGHRPAEVAELLEKVREDDPQEPFWTGVRDQEVDEHGVRVRFHDGIDPGLMPAGGSDVACLLYGDTPHSG
ncbi:MAG TPA: ABC transporter ATP-binding protein [Mycobacteriales bacterium]|nr:ABC transporter ATP-binding protein [Mycobacteriales bacterium]